jgi:hypothetical protein
MCKHIWQRLLHQVLLHDRNQRRLAHAACADDTDDWWSIRLLKHLEECVARRNEMGMRKVYSLEVSQACRDILLEQCGWECATFWHD